MSGLNAAFQIFRRLLQNFRGKKLKPHSRDRPPVELILRAGGAVEIRSNLGYQSRHEATAHLFLEAAKTIKYRVKEDRRVICYTDDRPPLSATSPVMSYSTIAGAPYIIPIPDFTFWSWPEVGIYDYSALTSEMERTGAIPPVDSRLFWIGNTNTSPVRSKLMRIAEMDPRIHAVDITWQSNARPERWAGDQRMDDRGAQYVSLPEHCRYRYLIDIEGRGFSARLKILLFSGRPVFIQEREYREFYFDWMEPYRHFIPVAQDLSNLRTQLDWAESHRDECRDIAANALEFAKCRLSRDAAIDYLREELVKLVL